MPEEVSRALQQSKFSQRYADDCTGPIFNTAEDLEEYVSLLGRIAGLYKKHIPAGVFDADAYRRRVAESSRYADGHVRTPDGYESFGIPEGKKVYLVRRDLFAMYVVEEGAQGRLNFSRPRAPSI